jgi:hypothetical protein
VQISSTIAKLPGFELLGEAAHQFFVGHGQLSCSRRIVRAVSSARDWPTEMAPAGADDGAAPAAIRVGSPCGCRPVAGRSAPVGPEFVAAGGVLGAAGGLGLRVLGFGRAGAGFGSAAGVRRVVRMRSTARVISVVATDKTTVAATIATTAHSGKWAGAAVEGGRRRDRSARRAPAGAGPVRRRQGQPLGPGRPPAR